MYGNYIFSQEVKDSLKVNVNKPIYYDKLSPEESWELHKKQYSQKLKAKGMSADKIEKKLKVYNKQRDNFLENIIAQRKIAESNRNNAEMLRDEANNQRLKAKKLRDEAKTRRKKAETERKLTKKWRNSFKNIITKKITLNSLESDVEPITFELKKEASLIFKIDGEIKSGITLIELFSPNGIMKDKFILEYQSSQTNKRTELKPNLKSFSKLINDADVGLWQIIINSQKSEGYINLSIDKNINESTED